MKNGLILQRDIHVKVMNKLIPKFNIDFNKSYIDSKVKVKRVRKYLTPMEEFIIYSSTSLPSSIPLIQWVNNPSCVSKASASPLDVDLTKTIRPLNWPERFALSTK